MSPAVALPSNPLKSTWGSFERQRVGSSKNFDPALRYGITGGVKMRWPPLPSIEEESLASVCEIHVESPTKRLQDDDPPEGSWGSIDQYPLINQVLCNDETKINDFAWFEDLLERSQRLQGIGSWFSGEDVIPDSGLLQRPPNAADAYSNHLFPNSDSVDGWPDVILEDMSEDKSWNTGTVVPEHISVPVKQLNGIGSWNDEAGNVSIFDCPLRPPVASTAKSTQVVFHDRSNDSFQTTVIPDLENFGPKIPSQSLPFNQGGYGDTGVLLQPETRPIRQEQLVNEVKAIYAGLVMVEKKCVEIDRQQTSVTNKLSNEQWQALIALHRTLLQEHHDYFLASQNPSHQSQSDGSTMATSPDVLKTIERFYTEASASSKPAKASDPAVSDTVPKGGLRMQRLKRFLPMLLNGSRYNTTPDTGSLENAISADEARRLGLKITGRRRQFLMGNGSRVISLGIVRLKCAFALGERYVTRQSFNVIDNLIVPVIIGKAFLDISKTMTLHQHRLEAVWVSAKKAFRVMHLNRPRQLVRCYVNGKLVHANPDTGSEVDLMSPSYARENTLKIEALEEGEDWVQFADGRTAKLLGKTRVDLDIYDGHYRSPTGYTGHSRTFYLLDGLRTDILLGEEALYDMHVFTEHEDSFVDSDDCGLSIEMNVIIWFDKRTRQMSDILAVLSSAKSKQMTPSEAQELLNKLHARELHQRELALQKLTALPAAQRPVQERLEQARQLEYNTARDLLIQKRNATAPGSQQHVICSPADDPG